MDQSGRDYQGRIEEKRRAKNLKYAQALDCLMQTRKKCTDVEAFGKYANVAMCTLYDRQTELMSEKRTLFRWSCEKKLQRFLSRVADQMFARSSARVKRQEDYSKLNGDELDALRGKLKALRKQRREAPVRRMVFFSDGTFSSTMRGQPSIPKKKLLKQLAVKGLTILIDEYNTSKWCPCGQSELIDFTDSNKSGKRVRVHKTGGGVCDVLKQVNDRDETATVQQLMIAQAAMYHLPWPVHLRRP